MVEVAAVHGRANDSLAAGYGYAGILVAFVARQNPLAIIPVAILLGRCRRQRRPASAEAEPQQRQRAGVPGNLCSWSFSAWTPGRAGSRNRQHLVVKYLADSLDCAVRMNRNLQRGSCPCRRLKLHRDSGYWGVPLAIVAGAIRNSTPFIFVSLGETLTEKSGRINLGQEGTLVMGAMAGFGVSYLTAQHMARRRRSALGPWFGVLAAGLAAAVLGVLHAWLCSQPRVNDVAVGIGIMLFGTGLAFYLGKPLVQPPRRSCRPSTSDAGAIPQQVRAAPENQLAVLRRRRPGAAHVLVAEEHALGTDRPHRRRKHRCRPRHGIFRQQRPHDRDRGRGISGRRRRVVSLALLSRAAGTKDSTAGRD